MKRRKILFATDVPFWQRSSGAEQRIFALFRFLDDQGFECGIFFLGEIEGGDRRLIQKYQITLFENFSDRPPEKLMNRIRWYADATIHQARDWLTRSNLRADEIDGPPSLTLADFEWPWAATRFAEVVESFGPDAIIFEYIKMAWLMDAIPAGERRKIMCLVDTHDVLHVRAEQFFANGFPHWLKIDRSEESNVLNRFDAILAIQDQEATLFREMVEDRVVTITVGHAVQHGNETAADDQDDDEQAPPEKIAIGYIGSKNFSNWQAIKEFLTSAWPTVNMKHGDACELVIAGAICDWFERDAQGQIQLAVPPVSPFGGAAESDGGTITQSGLRSVRLLGRIDRVEDFYDQIDVVINPVQFGTGLKIKNAESLRFGKLLITTLNGFNGMPEATRLACMVVESVNEMGLAINSICSDLPRIRPMQQLALQLAQTEFSESQAYSELKRHLDS